MYPFKKAIAIIGGIAAILLLVLIGVSLFAIHKLNLDYNRLKTAQATAARHKQMRDDVKTPQAKEQVEELIKSETDALPIIEGGYKQPELRIANEVG